MSSEKTFVNITNADIYKEQKAQSRELQEIKQHVIKTNGKVRMAQWVASTALGLVILVIGALIKFSVAI